MPVLGKSEQCLQRTKEVPCAYILIFLVHVCADLFRALAHACASEVRTVSSKYKRIDQSLALF